MPTARYDKAINHILVSWRDGQTLKSIAAAFNVDPGNLDRLFRRRLGMTVTAFVTRQRKEYVLRRLKGGRVFGYELGAELGFVDDWSFYRWAKRAFGIPFAQLKKEASGSPSRHGQSPRENRVKEPGSRSEPL